MSRSTICSIRPAPAALAQWAERERQASHKQAMRHLSLLLATAACIGHHASAAEAEVTTELAQKVRYERIEFLTTSPAVWVRDTPPDQGRYLRLVVYARVEENDQEMRVESWSYGDEGCCERLVRSRQFTLERPLAQTFGSFKPESCNTYFKFLGWVSLSSFRFSFQCRRFIAREVHQEVIRVRAQQ